MNHASHALIGTVASPIDVNSVKMLRKDTKDEIWENFVLGWIQEDCSQRWKVHLSTFTTSYMSRNVFYFYHVRLLVEPFSPFPLHILTQAHSTSMRPCTSLHKTCLSAGFPSVFQGITEDQIGVNDDGEDKWIPYPPTRRARWSTGGSGRRPTGWRSPAGPEVMLTLQQVFYVGGKWRFGVLQHPGWFHRHFEAQMQIFATVICRRLEKDGHFGAVAHTFQCPQELPAAVENVAACDIISRYVATSQTKSFPINMWKRYPYWLFCVTQKGFWHLHDKCPPCSSPCLCDTRLFCGTSAQPRKSIKIMRPLSPLHGDVQDPGKLRPVTL